MIRAHQAQLQGYKMYYWGESFFPSVITIFSAPNYCDKYNNKAAIIVIVNNTINFKQFDFTPHPFVHSGFIDIFQWSLPFVSCKIVEMVCHILKNANEDSSSDEEDDEQFQEIIKKIMHKKQSQEERKKRRQKIKQKIQFIGKMMLIKKALKENNDDVIRMKLLCPESKMPPFLLSGSDFKISDAIEEFNRIRRVDVQNEKLPTAQNTGWSNVTQGLSFCSDH